MTDNITSLHGGEVTVSQKQQFLDTIAMAYDQLAGDDQPVAMVYGFVGYEGGVRSGYHTMHEIRDLNKLHLSRAYVAIAIDASKLDG